MDDFGGTAILGNLLIHKWGTVISWAITASVSGPERLKPSITGPSPSMRPKKRPSACSGTAAAVLITEA